MAKWTLVIHGGASTSLINRESQPKPAGSATSSGIVRSLATANERGLKLEASLRAGAAILAAGGSALDAVEAAVMSMEDDEAFNCGRGSVFTAAGTQEMDASIMTGHDLGCGAVSGLSATRNPIRAARYVMEATPHVFFGGEGAEIGRKR
jgi:beta-aspartyl-peptidase (threonine type)